MQVDGVMAGHSYAPQPAPARPAKADWQPAAAPGFGGGLAHSVTDALGRLSRGAGGGGSCGGGCSASGRAGKHVPATGADRPDAAMDGDAEGRSLAC